MRSWPIALFIAGFLPVFAETASLPGCEPRPEVRQILDAKFASKNLQEMKFADRVAYRRQVLEDLIAKYPREVEPYRRLLDFTRDDETERLPELMDRWRNEAEKQPDDALAQYLAGSVMLNRDTSQSIQYLEKSRKLAPDFAWPALDLARIYSPGTKRADPQKAKEEIEAFFNACLATTDDQAQMRLGRLGSAELQARVATALRARLANETDPTRLRDYAVLWSVEFRARPPAEHDAVRKQVAADLARLEKLNPKPDASWLVFLKDGYKQSGAPKGTVAAMEDRLIQAFPHSNEACRIVEDRWETAHPEPEDQADLAAWTKYHAIHREALKEWMPRFTESRELQHEAWLWEYLNDPEVSQELALSALDDYLANAAPYDPPMNSKSLATGFLVEHKWQPRRVLELLDGMEELRDQWRARMVGDNLSADAEDLWVSNDVIHRIADAGNTLVAARLAEDPAVARRVAKFVEQDLPAKNWPIIESRYWQNRARLAALEAKNADALTYYERALQARKKPPQPVEGRVTDELMDESRALWKALGGTETAWNMWIKPPAAVRQTEEVGWKKPSKEMPAFALADLEGRTWRLRELAGRAVLINVWATWCGPCKAELPNLERLYERVRDRKDVQILTMSIDEDQGVIAPFMKEHHYTFPVLPAQRFVFDLLDIVGVPQNWILDSKGAWRWTGIPDTSDAPWEDAMLKQIESAR